MEPVEVTVRFDTQGKAYPQRFVWSDQAYVVTFDRPALARPGRAAHIGDDGRSKDV